MKAKRHLVTGGLGFIGSNLVRRLVTAGHDVRVLDNAFRGAPERLRDIADDFQFIKGDIRDAGTVAKAVKGADCVWHMAFINGTRFFYTKPDLVLDVAVRGMINILEACIKRRVADLMLASSSEVYQMPPYFPADENVPLSIPDPMNPRYSYAAGKIISEMLAINAGRRHFKRVVIFRPHNVYGPDMGYEHVIPELVLRMRELCKKSASAKIRLHIQGSGSQTRAFIFIDDFIDGLMLLAKKDKPFGIYNIGTTEEVTIRRVVYEIARYFNRHVEIVPGKSPAGSVRRRCPDISKIKALGYRPRYKLSEGLAITARWYDENA